MLTFLCSTCPLYSASLYTLYYSWNRQLARMLFYPEHSSHQKELVKKHLNLATPSRWIAISFPKPQLRHQSWNPCSSQRDAVRYGVYQQKPVREWISPDSHQWTGLRRKDSLSGHRPSCPSCYLNQTNQRTAELLPAWDHENLVNRSRNFMHLWSQAETFPPVSIV